MSINSTGLSDWEGALVVKPKVAWKMLACSNTRGYELLAAGELDSFLDGRSRKITVESIRRYIARHLSSNAASTGPQPKRGRGRPRKSPVQPHQGAKLEAAGTSS
jgi:hypothetical protein